MAIDINFNNIRAYDGSKQNGFEELVCQIAHLEKPKEAKTFIRKEGSGGDAGVECYWILENGDEYAWQAKYFTEPLSSSQWNQINDSVETAIQRHPNLTKYFVCVPRDRTDNRQIKNGKNVKSAQEYWNEYVDKWTTYAFERNIKISFEYWGKHELTNFLQQDNRQYTGKVLYWFNSAAISSETLYSITDDSRKCLGERFTPEHHVELEVEKYLSCIGCDDIWKKV